MKVAQLNEQHLEAMSSIAGSIENCPWRHDALKKFLDLETSFAWGIFVSNSLKSFIILQIFEDEAEIMLLVTDPLHRKKKLATKLLQGILSDTRFTKVERIFLEVSKQNRAAFEFYQKNGFFIVGQRKNYYVSQNNMDAFVLVRML